MICLISALLRSFKTLDQWNYERPYSKNKIFLVFHGCWDFKDDALIQPSLLCLEIKKDCSLFSSQKTIQNRALHKKFISCKTFRHYCWPPHKINEKGTTQKSIFLWPIKSWLSKSFLKQTTHTTILLSFWVIVLIKF